jgi:hypothetical protein
MSTTTDLSKFGWREWDLLRTLINAMCEQGLPEDFANDEVHPMFNMDSGNVFLTNSECQVAMMNGDKLESFYSCPYCGHEGFKDEIAHDYKDSECADYVKELVA